MITRSELEKLYEDETGLQANRGQARIDNLEKFVKNNGIKNLSDLNIFDDVNFIRRSNYRWWAGAQHGDTMLLGYTSKRQAFTYKNCIFVQSDAMKEMDYQWP